MKLATNSGASKLTGAVDAESTLKVGGTTPGDIDVEGAVAVGQTLTVGQAASIQVLLNLQVLLIWNQLSVALHFNR